MVSHILISCLNSVVLALLPYDDNNDPVTPCTSHLIYGVLQDAYRLQGFSASSSLYAELHALHCGSCVQEYITKLQAGVACLCSA
jgi:hypothetical protein